MNMSLPQTNPQQPRVSVIIPTYNCAVYLGQTLNSVFSQAYQSYEVIIVDDGSTDHVSQVLKPYADRIHYCVQSHGGPSAARNRGLTLAKGEYVAFLDGDDIFHPNKLLEQVAILDGNTNLGFVHSGWHLIDIAGQTLSTKTPWIYDDQLTLRTWLLHHPVFLGAVLFRRHWLERVNGFNNELPQAEDVDLFLRLAQQGCPAQWLKQVTVSYRQHSSSLTHRTLERIHYVNKVFREFFAQPSLTPDIQTFEQEVRFQVLMWCVQQLFHQNHADEMIPYLKESLVFLPSSRFQVLRKWMATLLGELTEQESSRKKLRRCWPIFQTALDMDETGWAPLEKQLDWLLDTTFQLNEARASHVH